MNVQEMLRELFNVSAEKDKMENRILKEVGKSVKKFIKKTAPEPTAVMCNLQQVREKPLTHEGAIAGLEAQYLVTITFGRIEMIQELMKENEKQDGFKNMSEECAPAGTKVN